MNLHPGPASIAEMAHRSNRATTAATGYPCALCSVRPDVACRHRDADPRWKPAHDAVELREVRSGPVPGTSNVVEKYRRRVRGNRKN